jgi:hypothetical protein
MLPPLFQLAAAMMIGTDKARITAMLRAVEAGAEGGYRGGAESLRTIERETGVAKSTVARDAKRFKAILKWAAVEFVEVREQVGKRQDMRHET